MYSLSIHSYLKTPRFQLSCWKDDLNGLIFLKNTYNLTKSMLIANDYFFLKRFLFIPKCWEFYFAYLNLNLKGKKCKIRQGNHIFSDSRDFAGFEDLKITLKLTVSAKKMNVWERSIERIKKKLSDMIINLTSDQKILESKILWEYVVYIMMIY